MRFLRCDAIRGSEGQAGGSPSWGSITTGPYSLELWAFGLCWKDFHWTGFYVCFIRRCSNLVHKQTQNKRFYLSTEVRLCDTPGWAYSIASSTLPLHIQGINKWHHSLVSVEAEVRVEVWQENNFDAPDYRSTSHASSPGVINYICLRDDFCFNIWTMWQRVISQPPSLTEVSSYRKSVVSWTV